MKEDVFLKGLAQEALRSKDQRLKSVIEWCKKVAAALESCGDDPKKQEIHAAVTASVLVMEANRVEEMPADQHSQLFSDYNPLIMDDVTVSLYRFTLERDQQIVTVKATPMNTKTREVDNNWPFETLAIPFRQLA